MSNEKLVDETVAERGKVYGPPGPSHTNIGLAWTGLLQQHYGITLDHPLPAWLVAGMMVVFKVQRAARVYQGDNFLDARAYLNFMEDGQKPPTIISANGREREMSATESRPIIGSIWRCEDQRRIRVTEVIPATGMVLIEDVDSGIKLQCSVAYLYANYHFLACK